MFSKREILDSTKEIRTNDTRKEKVKSKYLRFTFSYFLSLHMFITNSAYGWLFCPRNIFAHCLFSPNITADSKPLYDLQFQVDIEWQVCIKTLQASTRIHKCFHRFFNTPLSYLYTRPSLASKLDSLTHIISPSKSSIIAIHHPFSLTHLIFTHG